MIARVPHYLLASWLLLSWRLLLYLMGTQGPNKPSHLNCTGQPSRAPGCSSSWILAFCGAVGAGRFCFLGFLATAQGVVLPDDAHQNIQYDGMARTSYLPKPPGNTIDTPYRTPIKKTNHIQSSISNVAAMPPDKRALPPRVVGSLQRLVTGASASLGLVLV